MLMAPEGPNIEEGEAIPMPRQGAMRGRPPLKAFRLSGPIKKHKCTWDGCNKSFSRKSDLNRHNSIHTNTRNHHCNFPGCGKSFIQTSALTVHKRTHTGEKPHECPLCEKAFADSSSLSRHRRTHRPDENIFKCTKAGCSDAFSRQFELDRHVDMKHGHGRAEQHAAPAKRTDSHAGQNQILGLREEQLVDAGNSNHQGHQPYLGLEVVSPSGSGSGRGSSSRNNLETTIAALVVRPSTTNPYARSVAIEEGYFSSQPATPTLPFSEWQQWHQPGDQRSYSGRVWSNTPRPHLPEPLPNLGLGSHVDAGPMSAPAYPTHHYQHFNFLQSNDRPAYPDEHRGQDSSMTASTPVSTSECHQPSITSIQQCQQNPTSWGPLPSLASYSTTYEQRLGSRPLSQEQLSENAAVGRAGVGFHENEEMLKMDMLESSQEPEADIFSQIAPHYEEPRDLGSVSAAQHYRLPSMSFDLSLQDDDKVMTDFGEPLPSQVM